MLNSFFFWVDIYFKYIFLLYTGSMKEITQEAGGYSPF